MKRKSERAKQRAKEWRAENPDKCREQQLRKRLRAKGLLEPYVPPVKKSEEEVKKEQAARMKEFHKRRKERLETDPEYAAKYRAKARLKDKLRYEARKADPEAYKAWLEGKRQAKFIRYRLKHGIPLDAPVQKKITDEEKARRLAEKEQRKAERAAEREANRVARPPKLTPEERELRRRAKRAEYDRKKRDLARARRAVEVANDKAGYPSSCTTPKVCPDPPELQALFAKASKGEKPFARFTGTKMGVFTARTKWM